MNGDGLTLYAILARSKREETVRGSFTEIRLEAVCDVVKECRRASKGVPEKILSVRSSLTTANHDKHLQRPSVLLQRGPSKAW